MKYLMITGINLLLFATFLPLASAAGPARPNILLIMTDDQGWGDVRSNGNPRIDTPVMDRLAADGAQFDRFFVSPVCAPTRASLMTGRYHLLTGTHGVTRAHETMRSEEVTIAEVLKKAGYVTGCFGKWHNGRYYPNHPNGQGFDEFFGFCGGHQNIYFDPQLEHNGKIVETKGYISDILTDAAIEFVRKNKDRPFFCYVPYNAPHAPFQVPDRYYNKYIKRGFSPQNAAVYGMCENLDDNIGRLLKELEHLGLARNTVVFFLTDNGPNTERFNGNMRGHKASVHEGGVRVPLFVRWPGQITPGTTVKELASHFDLLPTIAELTNATMPKNAPPLDGKSLVPLLKGNNKGWPDRMIFNHQITNTPEVIPDKGSARTSRYRATFYRGKWQLFDMIDDPSQKQDVAKKHPEVLAKLSKAYENWFADVTKQGFEPIPATVGHPKQPTVLLPGHEASLNQNANQKGISYNGSNGWAGEFITNWTSTEAYPSWPIDVTQPGQYEITLLYNCKAEDVGSKLRVEIGKESLVGQIEKAFAPPPIHTPDRAPHGNAVEKPWAELPIGTIKLPTGPQTLKVKATHLANRQVMDLKAVRIRKID